ncbi:response regulator [Pseudomonas sp. RP23018S]|uniref:response regulator n=1 Tax=Pseudomonas sp. RP23018S TaxID=3096037 RepID=UPI002ACA411F|nr:response regulator [Pseudomonas sp. RP23018S]MDZ5605367.1 response regulator [Pseudomonas sp. RP23018S]
MIEPLPSAPAPRILLVEDERMIRELIVFALEDLGATVKAVETADEGLAALEQAPWSLLLTDVQTPGMLDGMQLAWRAQSQAPELAVVVMSGYHDGFALPLPEGAVFLPKPWSIDQFYQVIEGQLARCSAVRPAA